MWLTSKRSIKRVLIYRLGSLGDTVVALPALHLTARAFPEAERRMLTSYPPNVKAPASSAILESTGLVHGYFRYTYGTRRIGELISLWWELVRWRPEVLVYMSGPRGVAAAKRDAMFFKFCLIPSLIGVSDTEDKQVRRSESDIRYGSPYVPGLPQEYECARLVRNLSELGEGQLDDPANWDLHLTAREQAKADDVLKRFEGKPVIAACIGTKMQSKDWERDNWSALIRKLGRQYPEYGLVLCGAPEEADASEYVKDTWEQVSKSPILNLCGLLTPRESAAVFARSVLFVGHDSGPMHLAAAVQTPCVAVFSSRNLPRVWFPYGKQHTVVYHNVDCQNCNLETCVVERKKCILSITVDEVLAAVDSALSRRVNVASDTLRVY